MSSEDLFERLEQQLSNKLPFVVYRKPNTSTLKSLLQKDIILHQTSSFKESGFVFAPFDLTKAAYIIPTEHSEFFEVQMSQIEIQSNSANLQTSTTDKDCKAHIALVEKGKKAIDQGQFQKVVLSRKEEVQLSNSNVIRIFKNIVQTYTSAFAYCWFHPEVGLWMGATPETLLKIEGQRFSTMALAGTQKFKGTTDVIWHEKEREEQQFVTDFILESLKPVIDNIATSEVQTAKAGTLLHLRTLISGTLNGSNKSYKDLIQSLHPTPAVCGYPKLEAKKFILDNEPYSREFYSGFLGELHFKESKSRNTRRRNVENNAYRAVTAVSDLYVNLRCMKIENQNAHIYVGGGITKDSDAALEWDETIHKSFTMKSIL